MKNNIEIWTGEIGSYKLLDSGEREKIEEIDGFRIVRPEPRAWWGKSEAKSWNLEAREKQKNEFETVINLGIGDIKAKIKYKKGSKHIGIFPEQFPQWKWVKERVTRYEVRGTNRKLKILNLFGYTGIASLVAGSARALVTHVDASKQSVEWAKENQKLSGLENAPIRWIVDDVLKFLKRELSRGVKYDAIIMDPPSYGKGPKGEVWKVESSLTQLLDLCKKLLSNDPQFIILNMYSIELSSISLRNLLGDITKDLGGEIINGELTLKEEAGERLLPLSLFAIWDKK